MAAFSIQRYAVSGQIPSGSNLEQVDSFCCRFQARATQQYATGKNKPQRPYCKRGGQEGSSLHIGDSPSAPGPRLRVFDIMADHQVFAFHVLIQSGPSD